MTFWPFLAMVGGSLLLLCVLFVVSARLFSRHASDAFKNALEVVKIVGFLLVAAFTFVFIDRQRQELSQAEYDFKVYQAFLEASNAPQTETRLRVLANITTYRQTFLKPGARLDNALVALSKTLVDDQSIKLALSAPANSTIASALAADRSTVRRAGQVS
jgi:hypothetical protein